MNPSRALRGADFSVFAGMVVRRPRLPHPRWKDVKRQVPIQQELLRDQASPRSTTLSDRQPRRQHCVELARADVAVMTLDHRDATLSFEDVVELIDEAGIATEPLQPQ